MPSPFLEMTETYTELKAQLEDGTLLHVHFKQLGITKYSRQELYGIMDLIGEGPNCSWWHTCKRGPAGGGGGG